MGASHGPLPVRAYQVRPDEARGAGLGWPAMRLVLPDPFVSVTTVPDSRALLVTMPQIVGLDVARQILLALPPSYQHGSRHMRDYLDSVRVPLELPRVEPDVRQDRHLRAL